MSTPLSAVIDAMEPKLRAAFFKSVKDMAGSAPMEAVTAALAAGDMAGMLKLLNLSPEFMEPMKEAVQASFLAGGKSTLATLPKPPPSFGTFNIRFGGSNPRAEAWVKKHSSKLITEILADQRKSVRGVVAAGVKAGRNPRAIALDIVGRVNRTTGLRAGGILGITSQQAGYVTRARAELSSGSPASLRKYLGRTRRDQRFDGIVNRAIKSGKPIPASDIDRMTGRYSDRLLKLRGDTIGRTEALASLHAGQQEALQQVVDTGRVKKEQVRRIWRTASDARVRDTHQNQDAETVGLDEEFSNGLKFPGDPGGRAEEVINCRCVVETRIDYLSNVEPAPPGPVTTAPVVPKPSAAAAKTAAAKKDAEIKAANLVKSAALKAKFKAEKVAAAAAKKAKAAKASAASDTAKAAKASAASDTAKAASAKAASKAIDASKIFKTANESLGFDKGLLKVAKSKGFSSIRIAELKAKIARLEIAAAKLEKATQAASKAASKAAAVAAEKAKAAAVAVKRVKAVPKPKVTASKKAKAAAATKIDASLADRARRRTSSSATGVVEGSEIGEIQKRALKNFAADGYVNINAHLRGRGPGLTGSLLSETQSEIAIIDRSMRTSVVMKSDTIVYRGMRTSARTQPENFVVGKTITDFGYMSTTLERKVATNNFVGELEEGILFRIRVPKGTRAVDMRAHRVTDFSEEAELLLGSGTKIRITKVRRVVSSAEAGSADIVMLVDAEVVEQGLVREAA